MKRMKPTCLLLAGLLSWIPFQTTPAAGLTAEEVLGDYKSAPFFGEAAAQESIVVEVSAQKFAPKNLKVPSDTNIRFLFTNSSNQTHLMVMALNINEVLADKPFIDAFLEHGSEDVTVPGGHRHGNSRSTADDASPMVKLIDEHPAVFLKPGDTKEILVRFSDTHPVQLACVLDEHHTQGMAGSISPHSKNSL